MRQRVAVAAVSVLLGVIAVSPALAEGDDEGRKGKGGKGSTTTTAPSMADDATGASSTTVTSAGDDSTSSSAPPPSTGTTGTTGTTATTMPKNTCAAPATTREPAPEPGATKNYLAGGAGDVDIERFSMSELRVAAATAAAGWTSEINGPSGARVAVKFHEAADPKHLVKFNASLSADGTQITVRVLDCRANDQG
jgi:hypothetical protein